MKSSYLCAITRNTVFSTLMVIGSVKARPVFGSSTDTPSVIATATSSFTNMSRSLGNVTIDDSRTRVGNWYNTTDQNTPSPYWAAQQETLLLIIIWVVVAIVATWIIMTLIWCFWGNQGLWARARHALRGGSIPTQTAGDRDIPLRELKMARRARPSPAGSSSVMAE